MTNYEKVSKKVYEVLNKSGFANKFSTFDRPDRLIVEAKRDSREGILKALKANFDNVIENDSFAGGNRIAIKVPNLWGEAKDSKAKDAVALKRGDWFTINKTERPTYAVLYKVIDEKYKSTNGFSAAMMVEKYIVDFTLNWNNINNTLDYEIKKEGRETFKPYDIEKNNIVVFNSAEEALKWLNNRLNVARNYKRDSKVKDMTLREYLPMLEKIAREGESYKDKLNEFYRMYYEGRNSGQWWKELEKKNPVKYKLLNSQKEKWDNFIDKQSKEWDKIIEMMNRGKSGFSENFRTLNRGITPTLPTMEEYEIVKKRVENLEKSKGKSPYSRDSKVKDSPASSIVEEIKKNYPQVKITLKTNPVATQIYLDNYENSQNWRNYLTYLVKKYGNPKDQAYTNNIILFKDSLKDSKVKDTNFSSRLKLYADTFYATDFKDGNDAKRWWVNEFKKASNMKSKELKEWAEDMLDYTTDISVPYIKEDTTNLLKDIVKGKVIDSLKTYKVNGKLVKAKDEFDAIKKVRDENKK